MADHQPAPPPHAAAKPNPALRRLEVLVGTWQTEGRHPQLPGRTLRSRVTFAWLDGGAFLRMATTNEDPEIPDGIAIFGSDDAAGGCYLLYFDVREVSRKYDVAFTDDGLVWTRDDPGFAQRFAVTVAADGRSMRGVGEMAKDGGAWEPDLSLAYTKAP